MQKIKSSQLHSVNWKRQLLLVRWELGARIAKKSFPDTDRENVHCFPETDETRIVFINYEQSWNLIVEEQIYFWIILFPKTFEEKLPVLRKDEQKKRQNGQIVLEIWNKTK